MSKEMIVKAICDNHRLMGDSGVEAHGEHRLAVDRDVAVVDLCEECENVVLPQILVLLRAGTPSGSKPVRIRKGGPNASTMPTVCPDCGNNSISRNALGQHLRTMHNKRLGDYPNFLRRPQDYEGLPFRP